METMMTQTIEWVKGDRVRIEGERGAFKVWRTEPSKDGSLVLFGGDLDPGGTQSYRDIMPHRLTTDKRKRKGG